MLKIPYVDITTVPIRVKFWSLLGEEIFSQLVQQKHAKTKLTSQLTLRKIRGFLKFPFDWIPLF